MLFCLSEYTELYEWIEERPKILSELSNRMNQNKGDI